MNWPTMEFSKTVLFSLYFIILLINSFLLLIHIMSFLLFLLLLMANLSIINHSRFKITCAGLAFHICIIQSKVFKAKRNQDML